LEINKASPALLEPATPVPKEKSPSLELPNAEDLLPRPKETSEAESVDGDDANESEYVEGS